MQDIGFFHASSRELQELDIGGNNEGNEGNEGDTAEEVVAPREFAPRVLVVRTARELQLAIIKGFQFIEIREHLDLSELQPIAIPATKGLSALLGSVPPEVWSIRVRHSLEYSRMFSYCMCLDTCVHIHATGSSRIVGH